MGSHTQSAIDEGSEAKLKEAREALDARDWDRLVALATDLQQLNQWEAAEFALQKVLAEKPDHYKAQLALIEHYLIGGYTDDAYKLAESALAIKPEDPELLLHLGKTCIWRGEIEDALAAFELAESKPGPWQQSAGMLFLINLCYLPDVTATDIMECAAEWELRYARPVARKPKPARRAGPLRIGYYSPDFRGHSITNFILPIMRSHDREAFELFLYSDTHHTDEHTRDYRQAADHWRDLTKLSVAKSVETIAKDSLDLLIDCAGLFGSCRPEIFAQRPAPVQAHLIGHNGTTGLSSIDYRFTDAICEPEGTEKESSEKLVRLEPGFHCYMPVKADVEPGLPPSTLTGHITFGSFNNTAKINDEVIALWCKVLLAVTGSRLLIKAVGLGNRGTRELWLARFNQQGIASERIDILPGLRDKDAHFKAYNRVDIALDTFPVNGTTTTLEGLWMGVPMITLQGHRHSARVSSSLLSQIGLHECIAVNEQAYISAAQQLAANEAKRKTWRMELRQRIQAAPLGDPKQFVPRLEAAYRELVKA